MTTTKKNSEKKKPPPVDSNVEKTPVSASEQRLPIVGGGEPHQNNLSTTVAAHLVDLMKKVTNDDVNPDTVNAACNCAAQISKIIKANIELQKMKSII